MFYHATEEEIIRGEVTDVYLTRAVAILKKNNIDKKVKAEFVVKSFPARYDWGILAGTSELLAFIERLNLSLDVRAVREGTLFRTSQPVIEIEGRYLDFCIYETAFLGLLCQASGIVTRAAQCVAAARGKRVICFGARRIHPIIAPMVERYAYLGGVDGVAGVKSASVLGIEPSGTMPHALILLYGDTVEATRAFCDTFGRQVKVISLIDTFNDEKIEAIRVAQSLGDRIFALRLDTPASRKGNWLDILREVRWELDLRGHKDIKLFLSGGLTEETIAEFNSLADGFGVGTYITNAPVLDFSLDIVEIEGKPIAKKGKPSGSKSFYRCNSCQRDLILPYRSTPAGCRCGGELVDLLETAVKDGQLTLFGRRSIEDFNDHREYIKSQVVKNIALRTND
jgi:nicotinate phosphoribosyltransferase